MPASAVYTANMLNKVRRPEMQSKVWIDVSDDQRVNEFATAAYIGAVKLKEIALDAVCLVGILMGAQTLRGMAWRFAGLVSTAAAVAWMV